MTEPRDGKSWLLGIGPGLLLSCLAVVAIWSVDYVPLHDGPEYIAACAYAHQLEDPDSPRHAYLIRSTAVTTQGYLTAGLEQRRSELQGALELMARIAPTPRLGLDSHPAGP